MLMLKKFLGEVVVLVAGKPAEAVADILDAKKHVNEFIIAKKLGITINQTRNILYRLSNQGLVSSIRKKDKKKGWYTYFWKLEVAKALRFLKEALDKRIDQINHQIKSREIKQFYVCELCKIELNEENALLHDFTCNECGSILSLKDNAKVLKELKKSLAKMERERNLVEEEIRKEVEKLEKKRARELKKEEKEKAKKKAEAAAKRKEARKKAAKTAKKKPAKSVKKKAVKKAPSKKTKRESFRKLISKKLKKK